MSDNKNEDDDMQVHITDLQSLTEAQRQSLVDFQYAQIVEGKICPHCGKGFDPNNHDAVWSYLKTPAHEDCFKKHEGEVQSTKGESN